MELTLSGHRVIENVVAGREDLYSGVVMAPWSSRIEAGKWSMPDGTKYEVPINEPERNNALHGLVYNQSFSVKRSTASSVELVIDIEPSDGYPFFLRLGVSYEIEDGELYSSFAVKNLSATKAPFGIGFHPYLSTDFDITLTLFLFIHTRTSLHTHSDRCIVFAGTDRANSTVCLHTSPAYIHTFQIN